MVTANARKLVLEPVPKVRTRKIRKVVINMEKIRRFLRIGGLIILLVIINASIQALLAQKQFRIEEIQSEIRKLDRRIGWLQCDLADRISLQQIEKLVLKDEKEIGIDGKMEDHSVSQFHLSQTPVLPPSVLILDPKVNTPRKTGTTRITDWLSGFGRTLAGEDKDK